MKTIHFVFGATQSIRNHFIHKRGEYVFPIEPESTHFDTKLLHLSLEDVLSKRDSIYIEISSMTEEILTFFDSFCVEFSVSFVSHFLMSEPRLTNFKDREREFALFLQLPHSTIYFDFFPIK